jgi:ADP-ribose pyrophosphatase
MVFEEKTISSEVVYEGPVFRVRQHVVEAVNGGTAIRDVVEHSGGAIMVAVTDDGKILMERQYRKPLEKDILELPAGKADPNEDPIVTATRELKEETGYTAKTVRHLVSYYPTCGYSNEHLHIYICKDITPGETEWDDTECMDIIECDVDELMDMVMRNEIQDSKTMIGLMYARMAGEI